MSSLVGRISAVSHREKELTNGNILFRSKVDKFLLKTLAEQRQSPQAAIISCSDSRVPVEIIFDAIRPGIFYVIRVAGNIVSGTLVLGSIEFAVSHLKVPHVILLGHTDCQAVKASINGSFKGEMLPQMLHRIKVKNKELKKAVLENLNGQFQNLLRMECVRDGVRDGKLEVCSMIYDLNNGKVRICNRAG